MLNSKDIRDPAYSRSVTLATPLVVRKATFRNRLVGLPVGFSQSIDSTATPTERMIAMYRRRALGGAAMITIEATFVEPPPYYPSKWGLPGFYSASQVPQYTNLTDAIRSAGSLSSIQIFDRWHADFPYEMEDLSAAQIEAMIDSYVISAVRARNAGFDAVNFQMSHGWPLSRFASPLTNHRKDKYGAFDYVGSQIIARARREVGNDLLLITRFNIMEERHGRVGVTIRQAAEQLAPAFETAGSDILDLTFGLGPIARNYHDYWMSEHIYDPPGDKFRFYESIRAAVSLPIVGRSGINDPVLARQIIHAGLVDLLGVGRQLLADPDFPNKTLEYHDAKINRCIRCGYCGQGTLGSSPMRCAINGNLGREIEENYTLNWRGQPKRVLVVGGGPAGLQAALSLAKKGCSVTLFEQRERLGGLARIVSRLPHLRLVDLEYAVADLERQIVDIGVEIRLGKPFCTDDAAKLKPDAIVLATGSQPIANSAPDASPPRFNYLDYLEGSHTGSRVIVDGHAEGAEFAVALARGGCQTTLVEASESLNPNIYDYAKKRVYALADSLVDYKVATRWNSRVTGSEDGRVIIVSDDKTSALEADSVLIAGRQSLHLPTDQLRILGIAVYEIGDCVSPRGIGEAMEEGRRIANIIS